MTKQLHLRWYCVNCQVEHSDDLPAEEAFGAAAELFSQGAPYVLLTDLARNTIFEQDAAEAEARSPSNLTNMLASHLIGVAAEDLISRVFAKPDKSA